MSIATLTSLIVTGGTISSQIYDSLPPLSSGDAPPLTSLFEELNTLNTALSRLLTALLDPRRARCIGPFTAQLDGILSGCRLTYEELNDDIDGFTRWSRDSDKDVVQFWRRVQAHGAGLELLLTVLEATEGRAPDSAGRTGGVAVQASPSRADNALVSTSSVSVSQDTSSGVVTEVWTSGETTTAVVLSSTLPVESPLEDVAQQRRNDSSDERLNGRRTPDNVVDNGGVPVAVVPNIKEVIPPIEQVHNATDGTTTSRINTEEEAADDSQQQPATALEPPLSPNPKEIIDDQTRNGLSSPSRGQFENPGEDSAIPSPPLSPNLKEIINEDTRRSFQRPRIEGADVDARGSNGDTQIKEVVVPNSKEIKRSEGKMALDEDKSIQVLQKAAVNNPSERIEGSSSRSEPIVLHRDAQPMVLPDLSTIPSRIIAASKPDTPITETEETPQSTAISRTRETATGRAPIENTATNCSSATTTTIETSESSQKPRERASTNQSIGAPPSLKSDSTASLASSNSLRITAVDADKEVVSELSSSSLPPTLVETSVAELQGSAAINNRIVELPGSKAPATMMNGKPGAVTLGAVLRKETKPPYSFNNFRVYMRDEAYAIELLECWIDMKQHNDLCNFFVLERLPESAEEEPTPSQVSAYIRSIFSHPHHHHHTSPQHLAAIANADAGHSICRADLRMSTDNLFCQYLDPGADKDVTSYLKKETWESVKKMLDPKQEGRVDPEAFLGAWREVEDRIEKDYFPGFMKKRKVFKRRFFSGM